MIELRPTNIRCDGCGRKLDAADWPKCCLRCGALVCATCLIEHAEEGRHNLREFCGNGSDGR